jgi:undecaprenyl-diphosphatase
MNELNEALFLWLNAATHAPILAVVTAKFFAGYAVLLIPLALLAGWLRGDEATRKLMLEGATAGLSALLVAQMIGMVWPHPRPFALGMGNQLIPHAPNASFPSDHLTLVWAVSFSFLMHGPTRIPGLLLALLGLPIAWARIYVGVHWPLDMLGAAGMSLLIAWLCMGAQRGVIEPIYPKVNGLYQWLFAPLIRRGWVLK